MITTVLFWMLVFIGQCFGRFINLLVRLFGKDRLIQVMLRIFTHPSFVRSLTEGGFAKQSVELIQKLQQFQNNGAPPSLDIEPGPIGIQNRRIEALTGAQIEEAAIGTIGSHSFLMLKTDKLTTTVAICGPMVIPATVPEKTASPDAEFIDEYDCLAPKSKPEL